MTKKRGRQKTEGQLLYCGAGAHLRLHRHWSYYTQKMLMTLNAAYAVANT